MKFQTYDANGLKREIIEGQLVCYREPEKKLWDSCIIQLADIRPDDGGQVVTRYVGVVKDQ